MPHDEIEGQLRAAWKALTPQPPQDSLPVVMRRAKRRERMQRLGLGVAFTLVVGVAVLAGYAAIPKGDSSVPSGATDDSISGPRTLFVLANDPEGSRVVAVNSTDGSKEEIYESLGAGMNPSVYPDMAVSRDGMTLYFAGTDQDGQFVDFVDISNRRVVRRVATSGFPAKQIPTDFLTALPAAVAVYESKIVGSGTTEDSMSFYGSLGKAMGTVDLGSCGGEGLTQSMGENEIVIVCPLADKVLVLDAEQGKVEAEIPTPALDDDDDSAVPSRDVVASALSNRDSTLYLVRQSGGLIEIDIADGSVREAQLPMAGDYVSHAGLSLSADEASLLASTGRISDEFSLLRGDSVEEFSTASLALQRVLPLVSWAGEAVDLGSGKVAASPGTSSETVELEDWGDEEKQTVAVQGSVIDIDAASG